MNVKPWHYSLPCSYWLFLLPGAFCTDGVANWKPCICLPYLLALAHFLLQLAWPNRQWHSAATSTLGVFDKSLDERAETAGLGVFAREPALRWRLWNELEIDDAQTPTLMLLITSAEKMSHSSLPATCTWHSGAAPMLVRWDFQMVETVAAGCFGLQLPSSLSSKPVTYLQEGVLMVPLASPRWPCVRFESLNRLPPVVWWGNAGVFINQAMVGVHKF